MLIYQNDDAQLLLRLHRCVVVASATVAGDDVNNSTKQWAHEKYNLFFKIST